MNVLRITILITILVFLPVTSTSWADETIKVVTWNIEHLGSHGRGLGGIGAGSLPKRTDDQLKEIADFIRDELKADLIAVQEVAVTMLHEGLNISDPLEKIVNELGEDWSYFVGNSGGEVELDSIHNMQNAFIWNAKKVRLVKILNFTFPNEIVGDKHLFDRTPLIGYFQALKDNQDTNDFLIANVHLASGQGNDENHLVAMVIVERNLKNLLKRNNIKESDRIIMGDFNDNPFAKKDDGSAKYSDLLYQYMGEKKYTDLVTEETGATRMDNNLQSIIDHILVNNSGKRHLKEMSVKKHNPPNDSMAEWRKTYSDHFPLVFEIKVDSEDDDVD